MKKIFLSVTLFLLAILKLIGQENYQIDSTSKWIQKEVWGDSGFKEDQNFELTIQGDTIINDTLFFKMYSNGQRVTTWHYPDDPHYENIENEYYGAVCEISGVIYFVPADATFFWPADGTYSFKLYDFNYSIGDTISSYMGRNYIVQNIDTLENGRKRFYTNVPEELIIIEGIGSNWGFMEAHPRFEFVQKLGCYYQNDSLVYLNDEEVCNFNFSNIKEIFFKSNVFPNPATECLYIDQKEFINSVEIIDLSGIRQKVDFVKPNKIDISDINTGVYILKINHDSGILFIKK